MAHPYEKYERTGLWQAIERAISELEENQDLQLNTAREYVIGFLCQSLAAKGLADGTAQEDSG